MVFHDRRLQYTEHQQLEGWKWNRPGDRLLDIGNRAENSLNYVGGGSVENAIMKMGQSDVS